MISSPHAPRHHLILGGCGFIGRAVAEQLLIAGQRVTLADRVPNGGSPEGAGYVTFDLVAADWDGLIAGVDVVHHYAWSSIPATANADPTADLMQNVLPTLALLDSMRRLGNAAPSLVFTSSGGTVYGRLMRVPVPEDHPLRPITAYGASKAAVELYMGQYNALYGLDCRIARLSNPFGAGQNTARGQGAASVFLHKALRDEPIELWGDGEVMRDYIHVSDAATGLIALAQAQSTEGHTTFNIGSGKGVSLNGIISEIEHRLGRRLVVRRSLGRNFDVPVSVLDITLAREFLGWGPSLSFADGIARTIAELGE